MGMTGLLQVKDQLTVKQSSARCNTIHCKRMLVMRSIGLRNALKESLIDKQLCIIAIGLQENSHTFNVALFCQRLTIGWSVVRQSV